MDGDLKAVVFDLDGTLYDPAPLRRAMLLLLLRTHAARPALGWQTLRVLRAYRRAQETLRTMVVPGDLGAAQVGLTSERTSVDRRTVEDCVARWMEQEPLRFLQDCVQPGLLQFLQSCRSRRLRLGVLSDYPAASKLEALGLAGLFDVVLCAQAPEINVFKPDPRGLRVMMDRLGSAPYDTLYIGDRADVDAPTAHAAGVRCVIVNRRHVLRDARSHIHLTGYPELEAALWK